MVCLLCIWCYNQAGKSEPALQAVSGRAFRGSSLMDNGVQRAITIWLPEMQFFLCWDLDGTADHVGISLIGTDGSRVYTVEGNSGDACKIKKL